MQNLVFIYCREVGLGSFYREPGYAAKDQEADARAFAARCPDWNGWPRQVVTDKANTATVRFRLRATGAELLRRVEPGDVLILGRLSLAFQQPSDVRETLDLLRHRRVLFYALDLLPPSEPEDSGEAIIRHHDVMSELDRLYRASLSLAAFQRVRAMHGGVHPSILRRRDPYQAWLRGRGRREIGQLIVDLRQVHHWPYTKIAEHMRENRVPPLRRGHPWTRKTAAKFIEKFMARQVRQGGKPGQAGTAPVPSP